MASNPSADFQPIVSREQARNKIGDALRLYVGRGRRYSVKQLSNATGVPDWQINAAMIEGTKPDYRHLPPESLLSIVSFLGAEFTNEWLPLAGQAAFDLPDDDTDPGSLAADNADDCAAITRAAMDRTFDNAEKPGLKVVGARMVTRGQSLLRAANA